MTEGHIGIQRQKKNFGSLKDLQNINEKKDNNKTKSMTNILT